MNEVVDAFNVSDATGHIGALQFSDVVHTIIPLSPDKAAIERAIAREQQLAINTQTHKALVAAEKMFAEYGRAAIDAKVLILLTDGRADPPNPLPIADQIKAENVTFFGVGVGKDVNKAELASYVSPPVADHFFYTDSYGQLKKILDALVNSACKHPPSPPPATSARVEP